MLMRVSKKAQVINALQSKDYKTALKIAKSFTIELTKEENAIVRRAYEMQWNPGFYTALGFNAEDEFQKAVKILEETYKDHL